MPPRRYLAPGFIRGLPAAGGCFKMKRGEKVMSAKLTIPIPVWLDFIFTCPLLTWRLLRYGYTFRKIDLGDGKWTILDPQDYYRFCSFKWYLTGRRSKFYAVRSVKIDASRTVTVRLHREIMNAPKGKLVDHKNGDSLDNRRSNLRLATRSQNMMNRRKTIVKTSSKYLGVCRLKKKKRWLAQLRCNKKVLLSRSFRNEIDAAHAYDMAAKKYFGEFARLNFPDLPQSSLKPLS